MSAFTKFNRINNYPKYKVEYAKSLDYAGRGAYPVTFIGINNRSKYGDHRQPYVDILEDDDKHVRINVSHAYANDFDELIHTDEAMKEIDAGTVSVLFEKVEGKKGTYAALTWVTK